MAFAHTSSYILWMKFSPSKCVPDAFNVENRFSIMSPAGSSNETGDTAGFKDVNADKFVPVSMFEEVQLRASAADKKASHLNSLLGESESENARLSQLAAVLKVA